MFLTNQMTKNMCFRNKIGDIERTHFYQENKLGDLYCHKTD